MCLYKRPHECENQTSSTYCGSYPTHDGDRMRRMRGTGRPELRHQKYICKPWKHDIYIYKTTETIETSDIRM